MSYRRESQSEVDKIALVFDIDPLLKIPAPELQGFHRIYNEFIDYKTQSADFENLPCPSEEAQKDYASLVDVFGKDKPNEFPKPAAKIQGLHHVHVFDGSTDRELSRWLMKHQIKRVCDTLLFYGYFVYEEKHHFYILQYVGDPNGHSFQKDVTEMGYLIERIKQYKESVKKPDIK